MNPKILNQIRLRKVFLFLKTIYVYSENVRGSLEFQTAER